jgi:hypothetical protein
MTFSAFGRFIIIATTTATIGSDTITASATISVPILGVKWRADILLMSIPPFGWRIQRIMGFSERARLWRDPLARVVDLADPLASAFQMRLSAVLRSVKRLTGVTPGRPFQRRTRRDVATVRPLGRAPPGW